MQKAEQAGLSLSDDAVQALLTIPASHASEILEAVAEKHTDLRDPSNYVIATITRGYVPRSDGGGKSGGGKGGPGTLYDAIYGSKVQPTGHMTTSALIPRPFWLLQAGESISREPQKVLEHSS
ncbi:unnamed protein product [Cladocopium goreaui]|uniref:Uncharacterized protein n=1 Tax=Cladocopium goreaui TaxID=2562237 RepID=A0A9P1FE24_9DINO|nr:unnamed protein product [Cladocopium goreaui]